MACAENVPTRFVLGIMIFWGALTGFVLRGSLSLSIVTMVGKRRVTQNSTSNFTSSSTGCLNVPEWHNISTSFMNGSELSSEDVQDEEGEFDWNEQLQGTILSSFFLGYLFFQLPGGRLAELIGGRLVYGFTILIPSLLAALIPLLTRVHYGFLIALRIGQGLFLGAMFPTASVLVTKWVPLQERARFMSTFTMGGTLGLAVMMPVCGLIIDWLGWPALYYITAGHGVLFSICWFLLVHDSPDKHPRITQFEKRHIELGLVKGPVKKLPIPWVRVLTSLQFWGPFLTSFGSDWGFYTFLTLGPKYMASILGVDIKQNGVLSALPFLFRYIFGIIFGQFFDLCLRRRWMALVHLRKVAVCVSHLFPAVALLAFPLSGCNMTLAVAIICIAMGCNGALTSGHVQAYMDVAPNFAGTLGGLKNGLCSLAGLLSPIIIGSILEHDASVVGWRISFALSAVIFASSSVLFLSTYTGRVQSWNDLSDQRDKEASRPMRPIVKS
ncbi:sialin-like [Neocloeon triangulifer]|uniref:sialin-like n=1 Tax=Neocloeon triangulifer TaxID=2078957 RepID=UPI00286F810E|nr:sialin-like [Neocloeon triangulifer]